MNIKDAIIKNPILSEIMEISNEEKFGQVFVVGGFVRDYFFEFESNDIDLSVEKRSDLFSDKISKIFNAKVQKSMFETYSVRSNNIKIDIANMRNEFYNEPGQLPKIKLANSIQDDLLRRDFTINSLAACLTSKNLGEIIDPLNGLSDIKNHILRNNHRLSFSDDPTRIFRAIKYSNRFNLRIDYETNKQIYEFKKFIKKISPKRILNELNLLLEGDFYDNFIELLKYNIIPEIEKKFIPFVKEKSTYSKLPLSRLQKIYLLTTNIQNSVADNLSIKSSEFDEWSESIKLNNIYKNTQFKKSAGLSEIYLLLKVFPKEFLLFKQMTESRELVKKQIKIYLDKISKIKIFLNGSDLIQIGYKSGPIIGDILSDILLKKINGEIITKSDEISFAIMKKKDNPL